MRIAFRAAPTAEASGRWPSCRRRYATVTARGRPRSSWPWAATASCWRPCTATSSAGIPIYGMNLGTVGFLLNAYSRHGPARADRPRPAASASTRCG